MNPPRPRTVTWDLPTVRALQGLPFEPLQSSSLRVLSLKTTLLLALASVKQVGDLQALSVNPACLEFGPNDSKVVLKPMLGYVPKVLSTPFRAQVLMLLLGVAVHHRSKSSFHQRHYLFSGAWSSGVSISDICEAAGWSSPSTFARFYNLDVPALQARVLSA